MLVFSDERKKEKKKKKHSLGFDSIPHDSIQ